MLRSRECFKMLLCLGALLSILFVSVAIRPSLMSDFPAPNATFAPVPNASSSLASLIADPDRMCDVLGVVPKPYWMIFGKLVITQMMLVTFTCVAPPVPPYHKETPHLSRLQTCLVVCTLLFALVQVVAIISRTVEWHSGDGWVSYERYAYLCWPRPRPGCLFSSSAATSRLA
jgi:hypothetical protein